MHASSTRYVLADVLEFIGVNLNLFLNSVIKHMIRVPLHDYFGFRFC